MSSSFVKGNITHDFVDCCSEKRTFVVAVLSKIVLGSPFPPLFPVPLLFFDFFPLPPLPFDLLPLFLPFIPFFIDFFFPNRPFSAENTESWCASVAVGGRKGMGVLLGRRISGANHIRKFDWFDQEFRNTLFLLHHPVLHRSLFRLIRRMETRVGTVVVMTSRNMKLSGIDHGDTRVQPHRMMQHSSMVVVVLVLFTSRRPLHGGGIDTECFGDLLWFGNPPSTR
jgi:hypothetical protein